MYLLLLLVHFGRDRSNSQKMSSFESLVWMNSYRKLNFNVISKTVRYTLSYGSSPFRGKLRELGSNFHTEMEEPGCPITGRRDGRPVVR